MSVVVLLEGVAELPTEVAVLPASEALALESDPPMLDELLDVLFDGNCAMD